MIEFFHEYLYTPIYNLLVFLVGVLPGGDIGLAVIAVTVIVKVIIMPLSFAALKTQRAMKVMEPELKKIREELKKDPQKQAEAMFALYKKYDVKPLASFLTLFIQIPILITLYWVFQTESLPQVDVELLYTFIAIPATISPLFLGMFSVSGSSVALAVIAALTQFAQAYLAVPVPAKSESKGAPSMQEEFGRAMAIQMRYVLPVVIGAVAYASGAIALFFITSNIVGVIQELIAKRIKITPVPQTVDA